MATRRSVTSCQPSGAGFIAASLRRGLDRLEPIAPDTFAISIGDPAQSSTAMTASAPATSSVSRQPCCIKRSSATASMAPMPASRAAARMLPGQLRAGVSMKDWSST